MDSEGNRETSSTASGSPVTSAEERTVEDRNGQERTDNDYASYVRGLVRGGMSYTEAKEIIRTPQAKAAWEAMSGITLPQSINKAAEIVRNIGPDNMPAGWEERGRQTQEGSERFSVKTLEDGTQYVKLDGNIFRNADGSEMSPSDAYNRLIGVSLTMPDGDTITFVKRIGDVRVYKELFTKYPGYNKKDISDIKTVNDMINRNIYDVVFASQATKRNVTPRHEHTAITSFDERSVLIADNTTAYELVIDIANTENGEKIAYAKKNLEADTELLEKIKRAESRGTSPSGQLTESISQSSQKGNNENGRASQKVDSDEYIYNIELTENKNKAASSPTRFISDNRLLGIPTAYDGSISQLSQNGNTQNGASSRKVESDTIAPMTAEEAAEAEKDAS